MKSSPAKMLPFSMKQHKQSLRLAVDTGIQSKEINLCGQDDLDITMQDPLDTPDNGLESTKSDFRIIGHCPQTDQDNKSTDYQSAPFNSSRTKYGTIITKQSHEFIPDPMKVQIQALPTTKTKKLKIKQTQSPKKKSKSPSRPASLLRTPLREQNKNTQLLKQSKTLKSIQTITPIKRRSPSANSSNNKLNTVYTNKSPKFKSKLPPLVKKVTKTVQLNLQLEKPASEKKLIKSRTKKSLQRSPGSPNILQPILKNEPRTPKYLVKQKTKVEIPKMKSPKATLPRMMTAKKRQFKSPLATPARRNSPKAQTSKIKKLVKANNIDNKQILKNAKRPISPQDYDEKVFEPWSITIKISDDLYEDLVIKSLDQIIYTIEEFVIKHDIDDEKKVKLIRKMQKRYLKHCKQFL